MADDNTETKRRVYAYTLRNNNVSRNMTEGGFSPSKLPAEAVFSWIRMNNDKLPSILLNQARDDDRIGKWIVYFKQRDPAMDQAWMQCKELIDSYDIHEVKATGYGGINRNTNEPYETQCIIVHTIDCFNIENMMDVYDLLKENGCFKGAMRVKYKLDVDSAPVFKDIDYTVEEVEAGAIAKRFLNKSAMSTTETATSSTLFFETQTESASLLPEGEPTKKDCCFLL